MLDLLLAATSGGDTFILLITPAATCRGGFILDPLMLLDTKLDVCGRFTACIEVEEVDNEDSWVA